MKTIIYFLCIVLLLSSCSKKKNNSGKDTFVLDKVNVALIYKKQINDIPCSLYTITDTLKKNKNIGIIFKLDVHYDDSSEGTDCCAFERGTGGTKDIIRKIKIFFTSPNQELDVTNELFNIEESLMLNRFEEYIQGQFNANDFSCVCYNNKNNNLTENLKRQHLGGKLVTNHTTANKSPVIKNIKDFIDIYNSLAGETYKGMFDTSDLYSGWKLSNRYYNFWLPEQFNARLEKFETLEIQIKLLSGRTLQYSRVLHHEVKF